MGRQLKEPLSLAGSIVAIVAFVVTYGKSVDPLSALGVAGLAYLTVVTILLIDLLRKGEIAEHLRGPDGTLGREYLVAGILGPRVFFGLWLTLVWLAVAVNLVITHWSLRSFILLVTGVGALFVLPMLVYGFIKEYKERHKPCPECGNEVLAVARVCQYCGYRWQPALPSAF